MKPRYIIPALAASLAAGALFTLHAQDDAPAPGQQKQFRFEFRNDGSGPRLFRDGKEVKPDGNGKINPMEEMQKEMQKQLEDMMRQHGGGGSGQGKNPLDDLLKRMGGERGGQPEGGGGNLQDLFRQFQDQQSGHRTVADGATRYSKHHRSALAEWRPLVKTARESTVRIMKDNKQVAFGTIVSADGYALTKASEVNKDGLECEFHDGRIVSAKVIDTLASYDLALIKLDATGLTPANFPAHDATVGLLVAAVGVDEDPLATGVISIAARSLSDKGKGALGIMFATDKDESGKGVIIGKVITNCPAAKAGLKEGDLILTVNGTEVDFPAQLQKIVAAMKPGDTVKLRYSHDGKEADMEFPLTSREELTKIQQEEFMKLNNLKELPDVRAMDPTARMGGSLSSNATGYPNAVQTDLTIDSQDCGGPVVDVDGHVVAIAIARSERVSTFLIPSKVIQSLLTNLKDGKFTLSKDADTLSSEVREYDAAIHKAQEAMKAAEAKRAEAEAELKKLGK